MRIVPEHKRRLQIGDRFERLTVIGAQFMAVTAGGQTRSHVVCQCECGAVDVKLVQVVSSGHSRSCGCLSKDVAAERMRAIGLRSGVECNNYRHGGGGTRLYSIWKGMRKRCNNPRSSSFQNYGAKGIRVCDEWSEFENFKAWSTRHGYADDLTIDRLDSDKDYSPSNCQWVTKSVNSRRAMEKRWSKAS